MGVDYRETKPAAQGGTQFQMVTYLQLMQFGVPLAYTTDGFSIAFTPILQYGALDINYLNPSEDVQTGSGVAQDLEFGYNIGLAYAIDGVTVGMVYKSQIDMDYKDQLPTAMKGFRVNYNNTKLSTPAEIGLGVAYSEGEHTVAFDYKQIKWSSAKGYEDFKWDDQDVFALGYEYKTKEWAARVGYNYASSPISEQTDGLINTFNLLGFPAIVESHYTVGGSYAFDETTSLDAALTYAPEVSQTYKNFANQDITTKHSQTAVSVQLNYAF